MEPSSDNDAPVSAKKPLIDNMLALEQKSTFVPEKAAELFVEGQKGIIMVSCRSMLCCTTALSSRY